MRIDAEGLHYRTLNEKIHRAMENGDSQIVLQNVRGQRYIGAGLDRSLQLVIEGVPGNDLAAFMNGAEIAVQGNVQDGVANTMNAGRIVVEGNAGDVLGYAMRGGRLYVRGEVGYRAGIHMKAYRTRRPVIVIGSRAGDYLGEYMAGGVLVVLGLGCGDRLPVGEYVGTGMHGGVIYVRGTVEPWQLGAEVGTGRVEGGDWEDLAGILADYCGEFGLDPARFDADQFVRLTPATSRPYGQLYAY